MTLPRVADALRQAHAQLPLKDQVRDLAYLMDVEPSGNEALVVFVKLGTGVIVPPPEKRSLEATLRGELGKVVGYMVFFRWLTEDEADNPHVVTKGGLLDKPISALH